MDAWRGPRGDTGSWVRDVWMQSLGGPRPLLLVLTPETVVK